MALIGRKLSDIEKMGIIFFGVLGLLIGLGVVYVNLFDVEPPKQTASAPIPVVTPRITIAPTPQPELKYGLTESVRKEIFKEIVAAERRGREEAEKQYSTEPTNFAAGQTLTLSKETPLMPEFDPVDPMSALKRVLKLRSGTHITILQVKQKRNTPWYEVSVSSSSIGDSLGSGWINSTALYGQYDIKTQIAKQAELNNSLKDKYRAEVANKYDISTDNLSSISGEGLNNGWAMR